MFIQDKQSNRELTPPIEPSNITINWWATTIAGLSIKYYFSSLLLAKMIMIHLFLFQCVHHIINIRIPAKLEQRSNKVRIWTLTTKIRVNAFSYGWVPFHIESITKVCKQYKTFLTKSDDVYGFHIAVHCPKG